MLFRSLVQLSFCLALLAGVCALGQRWISKQRLAAAFRWILLTAVYVFTAAFVLNAFMVQWGFRGENSPFGFERLLDHSAERPYVYRVLSPTVINAVAAVIPETLVADGRKWLLDFAPPKLQADRTRSLRVGGPSGPRLCARSLRAAARTPAGAAAHRVSRNGRTG